MSGQCRMLTICHTICHTGGCHVCMSSDMSFASLSCDMSSDMSSAICHADRHAEFFFTDVDHI